MRLGLKLFLATALAAVLVVPAAGAKPGNGGGNGNGGGGGKPSWAGQPASQGGGGKAKGKPAWAGQGQTKKAEQAQRKLERRAAAEADEAEGEEQEGPLKDNPAFVCKFERDMMGAEAFADEYGTNDNKANAFGMCVSEEAHSRDGAAEAVGEESTKVPACEPTGGEPVEGEEEPVEDPNAPAEGECPEGEDADSGEDVEEGADGETDEGSEEDVEEDGGSSTEEILAALRLLL